MYMFPDMVNMGLPKGASWPSEAHKQVAVNLLICNPNINNMDLLHSGVVNILNIPEEKIKTITLHDLSDYGFDVGITAIPR
jgi:hypothetical protein